MRMKLLWMFSAISSLWAANATPDQIRNAATKGLAAIQASQKGWYAKQSCASCHQQYLAAMAVAVAREHGVSFDESLANDEASRLAGLYSDLDRAVQYTYLIDPALDDAGHLIAVHYAGVRPNLVTAIYARHIASHQLNDGHWATLDARPPQSYSAITATATAIRAIQFYGHPSLAADTKARVEKARAWLASVSPRDTQERVDQLTGLSAAGADRELILKLRDALKATQRSDGGWSARDGLPSDAYSTGQVLVALNDAAVPFSDPGWQRGLQFLVSTQAADGTWHVVSRLKPPAPVSPPYFETGYPYGHDQFISAMGAAWAVTALARTLPASRKTIAPIDVKVAAEPWMETLLFGSATDVRGLLDRKFDPNSATKPGTTALMFAMPDVEKGKALIERGAKINARSKTRYSALMVAAQYRDGTPAMRYLLSKGAEVRLPKGQGTPLFNASPLMFAALAGNTEMIRPLHDAGDDVNSVMLLLGIVPGTPLLEAVSFNDAPLVRALLDAGASIDMPDSDGITALGWAAIANRTDAARVLIERKADVNHVDKKGMTPLLYAASIDFGDGAIAQMLLKAGANPKAKTPEGLTAAQLASRYGHAQVVRYIPAASALE